MGPEGPLLRGFLLPNINPGYWPALSVYLFVCLFVSFLLSFFSDVFLIVVVVVILSRFTTEGTICFLQKIAIIISLLILNSYHVYHVLAKFVSESFTFSKKGEEFGSRLSGIP